MKVGILIMATLNEPSSSNVKAMKETFVDFASSCITLNHDYDFYFYYACKDKFNNDKFYLIEQETEHIYNVYINVDESIYRTFEKTYYTLYNVPDYDWYIRINISSFLNIKLFDKILSQLDKDTIYCNAINSIINAGEEYNNDIYPRGDFFVISNKIKNEIKFSMEKLMFDDTSLISRLEAIHVDDVLLGIALVNTYGANYYNKILAFNYGFYPSPHSSIDLFTAKYNVCNRVKTIPPNVYYSGYSWEDNKYRRYDCEKMKVLNDYYRGITYDVQSLNSLLADEQNCRPTLFQQLHSVSIANLKQYLKEKRKG